MKALPNCSVVDWPLSGPPEDSPWMWLHGFVKDIGRSMSLSDVMEKHSMDRLTYSWLVKESPWFRDQMRLIVEIKRVDAELSTLQAAIGHRQKDEQGNTITDADGIPIRRGRDTGAAKYIFEREERAAGIGVGVGVNMISAAADDAMTVVRRQNGLMQMAPWVTVRSDTYIYEIGMFDAGQMARLSFMGVQLPAVEGAWFVEVDVDRAVVAVRDRSYETVWLRGQLLEGEANVE